MRTIVPPQEVVNKFTKQNQDYAANSNRSLFFKKKQIFSWGEHFCIAKMITPNTLLFTEKTHSVSTTRHCSLVNNLTPSFEKIYCANPCGDHIENFQFWLEKAIELDKKLNNARKPDIYLCKLDSVLSSVEKYANFFNLEIPLDLTNILKIKKISKQEFTIMINNLRKSKQQGKI